MQGGAQMTPPPRTLVMATLEVMGGVRIGEACGGGDGHGALANDLCLMRPVGTEPGCEEESCELWVADSKTLYPRYVNFMGKSRGIGVKAAEYIRSLWKEAGLSITTSQEDGMTVERPDYWVARVSLLGMSIQQREKLLKGLAKCPPALRASRCMRAPPWQRCVNVTLRRPWGKS